MAAKRNSQRGFSLVELISAIVVVAVLATGFLSAFSVVLKSGASSLNIATMENLASGQMDKLLSGMLQSAVAAASTSTTFNVDGTDYLVSYTVQSSVVAGLSLASGVHVTVTVGNANCVSCVSLTGDTFDVQ